VSFDVSLLDSEGQLVSVPHFEGEGGTFAIGGSDYAELNVTYNYSELWRVKEIDGMTGAESEPILADVVERFGTERDGNYWLPTEGNVGYMANILLGWARLHPDAKWMVD
jgi:hypothetical protein